MNRRKFENCNVDRYITLGAFAKFLECTEPEAREKAQECDAITYNGKVDLKAVDEKLGTHYMELGPYGADTVPEWMQPLMNGSRIHI